MKLFKDRLFRFQNIVALACLLLIVLPVLLLVIDAGRAVFNSSVSFIEILPNKRTIFLLLKSIGASFAVAVICILISVSCVVVFSSEKTFFIKGLEWWILTLMLIPPYVHAMAWMDVLKVMKNFNIHISSRGWVIATWVQAMYMLPLAVSVVFIAFKSVSNEIISMARLEADDRQVFRFIVFPLTRPLLFGIASIIFILSLADYTIMSLFGANNYALEIFSSFASQNSSIKAFFIALPMMIICIAILLISYIVNKGKLQIEDIEAETLFNKIDFPVLIKNISFIGFSIFFVQVVLLPIDLMGDLEAWKEMLDAVKLSGKEIFVSIGMAFMAASLSLILAYYIASFIARKNIFSKFLFLLVIFQLGIPASLTGIAIIRTFNAILPDSFIKSWFLPVLGQTTRFLPIVVIILLIQIRRINSNMLDASKLETLSTAKIFYHIKFPILKYGLLAAGLIVFVLSMGELGATLLLVPPGVSTLTIKIYNYLHYGSSEIVKALCLVVFLGAIFSGLGIKKLLKFL